MRPGRERLLTEPIDEVRYLAAGTATGRYRLIMRFFYEQHRLHQYALTPAQVRKHVETALGFSYTEEECQQDLKQLSDWGNLEPDWELGLAGVRTIEDFRRRNVVYTATPDAIAIEALICELEQQGEQVGQLDGSAMARLWERFEALEAALALPAGDPQRGERVRQCWEDLWLLFDEMADSSNRYMGSMRQQEKERLLDLEAFQLYKETVIAYLTRFSEGLSAYRDRFRSRLSAWDAAAIAATVAEAAGTTSRRFDSAAFLHEEYRRKVESLVAWFAPGGSADQLHAFASHAIERVLRTARRLSESRQGALSRAQDLLTLADQFYRLRAETETCERLAAVAFGLATPRHWQYEVPEQAVDDPGSQPWEAAPHAVPIRPRRSQSARQISPAAAADLAMKKAALKRRDRERREASAAVIDRLFASGRLDLAKAPALSPGERDLVLGWVYECLGNAPVYTTRAEDGSHLTIDDPKVARHIWLEAADGRMLMPAYTLKRELPPARGEVR